MANLGGVMAVIVHHQDVPGLALHLAAAVNLPQGGEPLLPGGQGQRQVGAHRAGRQRIKDVVGAGQGQADGAQGPALLPEAVGAAQASVLMSVA